MTANNIKKLSKGFTLIELLVVIGILAVLLAITLIAINPARQFAQSNNTKRRSDVSAILNAIDQYAADNKGALPIGAGNVLLSTCTVGVPCFLSNDAAVSPKIDICSSLVTQYIAALPGDPKGGTGAPVSNCASTYNLGYQVYQSTTDSRVTVLVPVANQELGAVISVTR